MHLKDKNILIIGANGGLGEALVNLLKKDNKLILTGRSFNTKLNIENNISTHFLDLQSKESIYQLSDNLKKSNIELDGIIFNSGLNIFKTLNNTTNIEIENLINVNLIGCILSNKILIQNLKKESFICNISSVLGDIGMPGYTIYSATKSAIKTFSQSLRRELIDTGIKVIYYQPRSILTKMNSHAVVQMNNELGNKTDTPEFVAFNIIKAIENDISGIFTYPEKIFSIINNIFPKIVDNDFKKKLKTIKKFLEKGV